MEINYEEIPDEEIWQDGEIKTDQVMLEQIFNRVFVEGDWVICRRIGRWE